MKLENVTFTNIGGLKTACVTRGELVDVMVQRVRDYHDKSTNVYHQPLSIYSTNGHSISIANSDKAMMKLLNTADLLHADGQSVVKFSEWFSNNTIPERSATTDTIHDVPQHYAAPLRHFLLGGKPNTIEKCADILSSTYDNFIVAGHQHGYFNPDEQESVIQEINASRPDVLWVGLGKPKEQEFIDLMKTKLNVPVIISCGGCYNFVTGEYSRAPNWMQRLGLEWLHRAATEPKKLLWRYMTTNPHAVYCAFKHRN
jgi:exopolysaccharide biosynthesis WecB/TagA/CpsF family protein